MLDERELGAYVRRATRSVFRLETLPVYDVPIDRGDFPRYLAGEPEPDLERARGVGWTSCGSSGLRALTGTGCGCCVPR